MRREPIEPVDETGRSVSASPALSQLNPGTDSIESRRVAVLLAPGFDGEQVGAMQESLETGGAHRK